MKPSRIVLHRRSKWVSSIFAVPVLAISGALFSDPDPAAATRSATGGHAEVFSDIERDVAFKMIDLSPDGKRLLVLNPRAPFGPGDGWSTITVVELSSLKSHEIALQMPGGDFASLAAGLPTRLTRPRWSRDSKKIAYIDYVNERPVVQVWDSTHNKITGFPSRTACGHLCITADFQWSPDSNTVYFVALKEFPGKQNVQTTTREQRTRDDRRRLLLSDTEHNGVTVLDSATGSAGEVLSTDVRSYSTQLVAFDLADGSANTVFESDRVRKAIASPDGKVLLAFVDRDPISSAKQGFADYVFVPVSAEVSPPLRCDRRNGSPVRVGSNAWPVIESVREWMPMPSWSPDGRKVAFSEQGELAEDAFVFDLETCELTNLTRNLQLAKQFYDIDNRNYATRGKFGQTLRPPVWSRDGKYLYFLRQDDGRERQSAWVISVDTKVARKLTSIAALDVQDIPNHEGLSMSASAEGALLASASTADPDRGSFIEVEPDGRQKTLAQFPSLGTLEQQYAVSQRAGVIAFIGETASLPPEVYVLRRGARSIAKVTSLNANASKRPQFPARTIQWRGAQGQDLVGKLYLPPSQLRASTNQRLPVVLHVYPGLSRESILKLNTFAGDPNYFSMPAIRQFLNAGYAVLEPELPVAGNGETCNTVSMDVVAGLAAAAKTGLVDPGRAGIFGQSFGGWAVNCVVTRTREFSAAVSVSGMSDTFTDRFSWSYMAYDYMGNGGQTNVNRSFAQAPLSYLSESPLFSLADVTTPLLLVHGKEDDLALVDQSLRMYFGLKRLAKATTLVAYDGRGHGDVLTHPDFDARVVRWFDKYLKQ